MSCYHSNFKSVVNAFFKLPKCTASGKTCYPDKKSAQQARNRRLSNGASKYRNLRIYCCPDCNSWHLTHVYDYRNKTRN